MISVITAALMVASTAATAI
jgi:hypothetical protein